MAEELLIEQWNGRIEFKDIPLSESNTNGLKPGLYIEGVFLQAEVVNGNKRLYPRPVLEKAVDKYIKEQILPRQSLGELNHPPRANVDPMHAALIIEDLWWEGNNVIGRARIIEGDGAEGDKLAALIRAGWVPGVSSRGLGSTKQSGKGYVIVQEGFKLTVGVDAVWGPSAPDAFVKPLQINESKAVNAADTQPFQALVEKLNNLN